MPNQLLHILIVEDNPTDIFFLKESFKAVANCDFHVVSTGDMAFQFLERRGAFSDAPVPDLAVIDLNLPGRDGSEILDLIRRTPTLEQLHVAIVSSSPKDLIEERVSRADCYITKPIDLDEFMRVGDQILTCYRKAS